MSSKHILVDDIMSHAHPCDGRTITVNVTLMRAEPSADGTRIQTTGSEQCVHARVLWGGAV